jgi:hypothetical protein
MSVRIGKSILDCVRTRVPCIAVIDAYICHVKTCELYQLKFLRKWAANFFRVPHVIFVLPTASVLVSFLLCVCMHALSYLTS